MVIISKFRLEHKEKIFVISEEDPLCPLCESALHYRDRKHRIHKKPGGVKCWFVINRLKCSNKACGKLHNELPDCIVPYKHYSTRIIEDVIDEVITPDDMETENYPCEKTMKHWKWWLLYNEDDIDRQLRSIALPLIDVDVEPIISDTFILNQIRERISPGWLFTVIRFIYNAGGRIKPLSVC